LNQYVSITLQDTKPKHMISVVRKIRNQLEKQIRVKMRHILRSQVSEQIYNQIYVEVIKQNRLIWNQ
jgi:hypothetical protein